MKMAIVNKGDIVWARVSFPHKWWPGLVLTTDSLGVMVSFFNLNQTHAPTYFVESEVIPFRNNYKSIVGLQLQRVPADSEEMEMFFQLLHSALKVLGQRNILRLKCPRQSPNQMGTGGSRCGLDSLWPSRLLHFIVKVAVSPWVDVLDFVDATIAVAQVHVFRGYCITNQKANYLKQHNCLSSTQKMTDDLQSDILESEDNAQDISDHDQLKRNIPSDGISSGVLVMEDDSESAKYQVDSCCQTRDMRRIHVATEACDLNLTGESLDDAVKEVFKLNALNALNENRTNLSSDRSSKTSDSQSFLPANADTELTVGVGRETHTGGKLYSLVLNKETATYRCSKRRRLDQDDRISSQKLQDFTPRWIDRALASLHMLKSRSGEANKDCNFNIQIPSEISALEHIDNSQANSIKVDTEVEMTRYLPETLSISAQLSSESARDTDSKSSRGNKEARRIGVLGARSKERKADHQSVSSHSEYNSSLKVKRSEGLATAEAPTFLLMKFPSNFNLPSKQELVEKFSRFGPVDLSNTKVHSSRCSAYVAFANRTDAVASYEYARRKKMFSSDDNVEFWVRPPKRRTVESNSQSLVSSLKQKIHKLKPCLKHPHQLRSENRKKNRKVRLLLPEDSPGKVKLGAEDRRTIITSLPLHSAKVDRDETSLPGLEGSQHHPSYQIHNLYQIPVHRWRTPPRFLLSRSWQVAAGEESSEVEAQHQRELKVFEAIYTHPSAAHPNASPSSVIGINPYCTDELVHFTPIVPIIPIEDVYGNRSSDPWNGKQ